jgi:hypothetical protein
VGDSHCVLRLSPAPRACSLFYDRDPGACAPGFMLSPAPRARGSMLPPLIAGTGFMLSLALRAMLSPAIAGYFRCLSNQANMRRWMSSWWPRSWMLWRSRG